MILKRVQTIVDKIAEECHRRFGDEVTLIWFGSWIKGNAYKQSDIDLAIEYRDKLNQIEIVAFKNWLEELPTLYSIDFVEINKANHLLKTEIKQYGKIL
ncbi:MAG: nucleotidyltransferase domain-containing protein [Gammaproteobacteria bacterium]|jgi:predicted nucleotidyltransferase|nr:MAG: nucleotidyltransferase domain-containing protein [Gammaproteobacteria bacterium]RKZ36647.1 MAG: nucleotidyltransferase domain-containing protein [Gammaproteobacteria bacterium]RKZ76902.1 MAG: nucleotidyltransferase domain-containing protein [Gammaproteobacteria bacterium]